MNVIVVGLNYATTLGAVRSLALAGYQTGAIVPTEVDYFVVSHSKYITNPRLIDMNFRDLFRALEEIRGEDERALVIPANDQICMMLDQHAAELGAHYELPNVDHRPGALSLFMNKFTQKKLAEKFGLLTAAGFECDLTPEGIDTAVQHTEFPCIVKPTVSAEALGSKDIITVCGSQEELKKTLEFAQERSSRTALIEQYLQVENELSAYGLALDGEVCIPGYISATINGYGYHKGIAAEGMVCPSEQLGPVKQQLEEFVRESGLNGLFCIDLLSCGGRTYFSEMNLRCGSSAFALTMAGANLPGILADYYCKDRREIRASIDRTVGFVNEKEALGVWRGGHISTREFLRALRENEIRFLKDSSDPGPWRQYRKLLLRGMIAKAIKGPQD